MNDRSSVLLDKIRQQFDFGPYPRIPLEQFPTEEAANALFIHNLVTPYYRRYGKVVSTERKLILDAGCGTGYKSLLLAVANPGAKIVGIDISEESIKLARQRLEHHQLENTEFHVLSLEELPKLGLKFDYINCDEVLYILPNPAAGLQAMKAVLKPQGIIRCNLHSAMQRVMFFRGQKLFQLMGLLEENPTEMEIDIVNETMTALKDDVTLKATTWKSTDREETQKERILMNQLFQGDKGYTIPDMFALLEQADLELISMVKWRHWDITDLFKDADDLPVFWAMSLAEMPIETRLHIYELLHPVHRLLDFWCTPVRQPEPPVEVAQWDLSTWRKAKVSLHPQLQTAQFKTDLIACITGYQVFEISRYMSLSTAAPVTLDSSIAALLLPLLDGKQTVMSLVEYWLKLRPLDPITLEPFSRIDALQEVSQFLNRLEAFLYVLPELSG